MYNNSSNNKAIICVDDERVLLSSLKYEISSYMNDEYNIEIAENGPEAIEIVNDLLTEGYDIPVVISDYIMPGMKGDILLKEIHMRSPETIKILLTGQAVTEGVANAINNAELYKYFDKPWDRNELKNSITDAIKLYYSRKQQKQDLDTLLIHERRLINKIAEIEERIGEKNPDSSKNLNNLRNGLTDLKNIYQSIQHLKREVDFFEQHGTYNKGINDIAATVENIKQELDKLNVCFVSDLK